MPISSSLRFTLVGALLGLSACSRNVITTSGSGPGGAGSTANGQTNATSTGGPGPSATASTGAGKSCGNGIPCGSMEFCAFSDHLCGKGVTGTCEVRPGACPQNYSPTCGCDGTIHGNECEARAAGVDVNSGGCPGGATPPGEIPCGAHYCQASSTYCEVVTSDVSGIPSDYACKPLPPGCNPATTSCTCFPASTPCVQICSMVLGGGVGGFKLTCPGG